MEKLFSSPEVEAEISAVNRKHKREGQLSTFNKLQLLASEKLLQLDEFITLEIGVRYKLFVDKVKGVELSHLLRQGQGPSTQAPAGEAPSAPRLSVFKPNKSFLEAMP